MIRERRGIHHDRIRVLRLRAVLNLSIRSSTNSHPHVASMFSLTHVFGDASRSPERIATTDQNKQGSIYAGVDYIILMLCRGTCGTQLYQNLSCSSVVFQEQGPHEAAKVVYALVRPALMRLTKHDSMTPPPLPVPSAPVPQPCFGKLRDGSCLQK